MMTMHMCTTKFDRGGRGEVNILRGPMLYCTTRPAVSECEKEGTKLGGEERQQQHGSKLFISARKRLTGTTGVAASRAARTRCQPPPIRKHIGDDGTVGGESKRVAFPGGEYRV